MSKGAYKLVTLHLPPRSHTQSHARLPTTSPPAFLHRRHRARRGPSSSSSSTPRVVLLVLSWVRCWQRNRRCFVRLLLLFWSQQRGRSTVTLDAARSKEQFFSALYEEGSSLAREIIRDGYVTCLSSYIRSWSCRRRHESTSRTHHTKDQPSPSLLYVPVLLHLILLIRILHYQHVPPFYLSRHISNPRLTKAPQHKHKHNISRAGDAPVPCMRCLFPYASQFKSPWEENGQRGLLGGCWICFWKVAFHNTLFLSKTCTLLFYSYFSTISNSFAYFFISISYIRIHFHISFRIHILCITHTHASPTYPAYTHNRLTWHIHTRYLGSPTLTPTHVSVSHLIHHSCIIYSVGFFISPTHTKRRGYAGIDSGLHTTHCCSPKWH